MIRWLKNTTFEEMVRELGLFKVKKRKPTSLLLTSAAWWQELEKIEPESSWRCTGRGQDISECTQVAIWKQMMTWETAFRYNENNC